MTVSGGYLSGFTDPMKMRHKAVRGLLNRHQTCVSLPCDTADHEEGDQRCGTGSPGAHSHRGGRGLDGEKGGGVGWMMERGNNRGGGMGEEKGAVFVFFYEGR